MTKRLTKAQIVGGILMNYFLYMGAAIVALLGGIFIGAGAMQDHNTRQLGYAFGCGRFYADNNDPALDPRNDESPCYPYYKAWDATEWHPPK